MPGPLLTFAIGESAKRGYIAGPLIVAGHAILELALVFSIAFGLVSFAGRGWLVDLLAVAGGIVIAYMGIQNIRGSRVVSFDPIAEISAEGATAARREDSQRQATAKDMRRPILGGIVISAANPYWILWWAGVVAAYFKQVSAYGAAGYISFFTGHILADLAWYSLVAVIVATGRRWFDNLFYRRLILASGIFLVLLGALFVSSGLT